MKITAATAQLRAAPATHPPNWKRSQSYKARDVVALLYAEPLLSQASFLDAYPFPFVVADPPRVLPPSSASAQPHPPAPHSPSFPVCALRPRPRPRPFPRPHPILCRPSSVVRRPSSSPSSAILPILLSVMTPLASVRCEGGFPEDWPGDGARHTAGEHYDPASPVSKHSGRWSTGRSLHRRCPLSPPSISISTGGWRPTGAFPVDLPRGHETGNSASSVYRGAIRFLERAEAGLLCRMQPPLARMMLLDQSRDDWMMDADRRRVQVDLTGAVRVLG
ncbi:hypothetical protein DFH09DRAFT_1485931 [Mycena vulgaris]|nr:hypothetical protein DFH09DRAFT_1485931 [Mycena vulgaris]